jgi:hypothetical protein
MTLHSPPHCRSLCASSHSGGGYVEKVVQKRDVADAYGLGRF